MSTSKNRGGVVASDGSNGRLTPETITDLGIKHGVFRKEDRASVVARAKADPSGVLSAVCARLRPAGPVTPGTPAHAASGASVAAGSAVPATTYPSAWSRAVSAAQRITGTRRAQPVKSAWPTVTPSAQVAGTSAPASSSGFYDKSPKASAFAASQEQARQADLARMAAEQAARFSG